MNNSSSYKFKPSPINIRIKSEKIKLRKSILKRIVMYLHACLFFVFIELNAKKLK